MSEQDRPIRAVVFDFGQTLVDSAGGFRAAEREAQGRIRGDLAPASPEEFLTRYREIRTEHHRNGQVSRTAIWRAVYERYRREPDAGLLEEWEGEYWERVESRTAVFPEAERVLQELSARYCLGLVTNTQGQVGTSDHRLARFPGLAGFFESVVIAGEAGVPVKPDPRPLLLCLEELGVSAPDSVYVGDDWRIDMCGAREAGMRPVWLQHHMVERNWPEGEDTVPVIDSLDALLDMGALIWPR